MLTKVMEWLPPFVHQNPIKQTILKVLPIGKEKNTSKVYSFLIEGKIYKYLLYKKQHQPKKSKKWGWGKKT